MHSFRIGLVSLAIAGGACAQEIGFVETFALAPDRAEALKELVPGTDDYFYYHALHAQNQGRRADFQQVMDRWIRDRNGNTVDSARTLLNRQALLDYDKDPAASLAYLQHELNLYFPHARKTGERRSSAPTELDAKLISIPTLLERAFNMDPRSLGPITDAGLERVVGRDLNPEQRRNLLARLKRPDYPGLVDLIVADLDYRDSRGYGHHEIHRALTLAQMDELLQKRPILRNESAFVMAYLAKLAPEDEVDLATDTAAREAYLDRLWAFVRTLDPVHNSLKACVLYHRLKHDLGQGVRDHDRFLEYVKLPREVPYLPVEARRAARPEHLANLNQNFNLVALPPIGREEPVLRTLLLHFLRDAANYDEYRPWIRDDYLKPIFAETKIVNGIGDPQQWAALLAPEEYKRLKERVDLDFAPENPVLVGPADPVKLTVFVKNVRELQVKVFEINTLNYYRETGEPLNLAVNLDGLVATSVQRAEYKESSERRVARSFEFPDLKGPGAYVIEFIGNGISSRALVQKGRLNVLQEVTAAGHAFTVFDDAHRRLEGAHAWIPGAPPLAAGKDGRIVVPFTAQPGSETIVIEHGGFATLARFEHLAETYTLKAGAYVDRETLLRRAVARIAVRPVLLVNNRPTSLKLLEEPKLVLQSADIQGIVTEKEITGLELKDNAEFVHEFAVPENAVGLGVTLKARIQNLSLNEKQDLSDPAVFTLNEVDRSPAVQQLHVGLNDQGYYVDLRGKNGEPRPGEPLALYLKHRLFRDEVYAELKTDEQGRARLGAIEGIERFRVREPMGHEQTWTPALGACAYAGALQGAAGETLRVPIAFEAANPLAEVSLMEVRRGGFVKDWHGALAMGDGGYLELRGLPAGDYSLFLKPEAREIPVRVTAGAAKDGFVQSARRALETPRLAPIQVTSVKADGKDVVIQVANANPYTRVHVFASRYLPAYDVFARLGFSGAPAPLAQPWTPANTFYESGRDIGDEYRYILDRASAKKYPGNMLDRPGLLLNPWALRDTAAAPETLATGGDYAGAAGAMARMASRGGRFDRLGRMGPSAEGYASFDFLRQPAVTLLNLTPDKNGTLRIPRADLKGEPYLRVVAVDPSTTVLRHAALADTPVATRELRLADGLDPAKPYAEQKLITPVAAQGAFEIADAINARFEKYDTVAKAYRLLATLGTNDTFNEFAFVAGWPSLDAKEQRRLYSKYACHELNFFLYHKDPAFFRAVIAPNLANKKDKTFLDRWLLNEDMKPYLEPWRFGRLNAVEQILLGRRLKEQTASVTRDLRERADLIPPNLEDFNRRFDTAVQTGSLEAEKGDIRGMLDETRGRRVVMKGLLAGRDGDKDQIMAQNMAMPAAAPAPTSPPPAPRPMEEKMKAEAYAGAMEAETGVVADAFFADEDDLRREAAPRLFQALDQTKEWAENNYYHRPIEEQVAELVKVNAFWADYAAHDGATPFLSKSFPEATGSFTEMMLALSVLDLPFEAKAGEEKLDGARYLLRAGGPLVVFHREIRETPVNADAAADPVLVAQFAFRADDRYRHEGNEQFDKPVTGEFLPHVVYGVQVALTNPGGTAKRLHSLLQIPVGALPVNGGQETRGVYLELAPYTTKTLEYYFYFPEVGAFPHYPVTVARKGEVIARAAPMTFHVVPQLTDVDRTSWAWISQNGTPEETLAFLDGANVHRLDLDEIAWRMHEPDFFRKAIALLEARHVYQDTLWSYGIKHNEPAAIREYLRHSPFADRCGVHLVSPLLTLDPVERFDYQHLEYAPLVNPRAHPVGAKRKIMNESFRAQYQRFMTVLCEQNQRGPADTLAVAYYLTLQDRVEDALDWFGRVSREGIAERMQYDYLDAYLAFYRGDLARAGKIAKAHADEGVDRWRDRFAQVRSQVDEIERGASATVAVDAENRDQVQGAEAAKAAALDLLVEGGKIRLDYRNVTSCALNFYPMDIELLFSRSPFLQEGSAQFAFIRPMLTREVALPAGKDTLTVDLPAEFRAKNVMVEAVAGGVRAAQAYYANTLRAQVIEPYGQVVVTHAETRKPVAGAYVKVYAKHTDGSVTFFKDGYTDLRGRFDYASLNTNELDRTERLALLILSDEFGALVREAAPPKR